MNFIKRIFIADERLQRQNAELQSDIRELKTEVEILKSRVAVLDNQNELLANVNAFNHRHIEDVLGTNLAQEAHGIASRQTDNGTPAGF